MRFLAAVVALVTLTASAEERVRVLVAVGAPEVSASALRDTGALREQVIGSIAATRLERWGRTPVFAAEVTAEELEALRSDPRVRAVDLDLGGSGALRQSVPLIQADIARANGYDGSGIVVAVLDTGIDRDHLDFTGRIVGEQCFCRNANGSGCCPGGEIEEAGPGAARDDNGHGTHVTGIIAAAGVTAPPGVAPGAQIVAVRVMDRFNRFDSITQIYRALEWILLHRPDVRVINMSLGTAARYPPETCGRTAAAWGLQPIIAELRRRGTLITASSGNDSSINATTMPACMQDVLGIGATYDMTGTFGSEACSEQVTKADTVACFSNSSESVDLLAPGARITSTAEGGGETTYVGTSMAAPHVAGAIALMTQKNPFLKSDPIEHILKITGVAVIDARNALQFSRIDVAAAVAFVADPPPATGPKRRSVRR
ncbi:MAG TPA: S8 family serine peptidase [Thermoanaerobaculia bacterium]|jgi:subtilisin family serine protease